MRHAIVAEAFLSNLPLFKGLPEFDLARLGGGTTRRQLARGEVLFREGEPPTGIHALVYGAVKLAMQAADGREQVADVVTPGRTFGEAVTFLEKPYIVTATAIADSLVLTVAKETLFAELSVNRRFAARIIGTLAERVESLVRELHGAALGTASERFVAWMLRRPNVVDATGAVSISLPTSKRMLASRLNVSAEHLSRVLHELSADGLIGVKGRELTIVDVERLRARVPRFSGIP